MKWIILGDGCDQDGNGSLSLEEFGLMMEKSPLRDTLAGGRGARMYAELASQEGILTKRDWLSLFRHVQVKSTPPACSLRLLRSRVLRVGQTFPSRAGSSSFDTWR